MNRHIQLDGDIMLPLRDSIDRALRTVFARMERKGSDEATISIRIDVKTREASIALPNTGSLIEYRTTTIPEIGFKVSTSITSKDEEKKDILNGLHELYRDADGSYYVLTHDEANGQTSMFDEEDEA